jgi:hypothetical protein
MMRIFVRRSSLTLKSDEVVPVLMTLDDSAELPNEAQWPQLRDAAMLNLPASAIQHVDMRPTLPPGWRETYRSQIAEGEAERRILAAFPEPLQRYSLYELDAAILDHGSDAKQWPQSAQRRKADIERAWGYVQAVRAKAGSLAKSALPADPTADRHWPARIEPYTG